MPTPCGPNISAASGDHLSPQEADQVALRLHNLAKEISARSAQNLDDSLREIAGQIKAEEELLPQIKRRNLLLGTLAKRSIKSFASRFPTLGEGIVAFLEGSSKLIQGARNSVDYQSRALHGKYFGQMVSQMEEAGVLGHFRRGELEREIYIEMGELGRESGQPGKSGSPEAQALAKIIDDTTAEMVAHQNRSGAYITRRPGYVTRQTHDMSALRALGDQNGGTDAERRQWSFRVWDEFTRPLLDPIKTFRGFDPGKFMRQVHEGIYTGIHGPDIPEGEISLVNITRDLGKKASERRVLHFKDAESAYKYNQAFGIKSLRDQVFQDLFYRSRNIALMTSLGPAPEATFQQLLQELRTQARDAGDTKSLDSLSDWKIQAAFDTVSGKTDIPQRPSLARGMGVLRSVVVLSKMGSTILSAFSDKAFLQSEMAYQGISNLETLAKQVTGMARRSGEPLKMLRMMGVAMDGLIGNTISRYTQHTTTSGFAHRAQQKFFDLNFMNWWTEVNKASAAELMAGHLGDHSNLKFEDLPEDLSHVLSLYDITPQRWDILRDTSHAIGDQSVITPDSVRGLGDDVIAKLITDKKPTMANIQRERDALETALRTYFQDRVDIAIPTPGAAERRLLTMGTRAGTPLGEGVRLLTLFKSFPLAVMSKILGREVYGRGSMSAKQWLLNDHQGKFNLAGLIAMATAAGYLGGAIKDAIAGKEPEPLVTEDGVNVKALSKAALRGGGLGIMGDVLFNDFTEGSRDFLAYAAGPVLGQLGTLMEARTKAMRGEDFSREAGKLTLDNSPYINLVYIRPILNYLVLWHLQEMMSPGSLERNERNVEQKNHQDYFLRPSDAIK